jgi:hypothetical protein
MLADGSAEQTLESLMDDETGPRVVIFSSYARDPERLLRLGATEVIQKPDFEALSATLEHLASGTAETRLPHERTNRRLRSREPDPLPEVRRATSGVAAAADLRVSLIRLIEGDSVLVVAVADDAPPGAHADPAESVRARATVGELLATTVRAQDIVHESPEIDGHVALLRGGDERAGAATFRRLVSLAKQAHIPDRLLAVDRRVDAMGGADAVARAIGALQSREGLLSAL